MDSPSPSRKEMDAGLSALLLQSVKEALVNVLGEGVTAATYVCLERQGLRTEQIPEDLPRFDAFLEDTFGKVSGAVIQRQIAKRLFTLFGLEFVKVPDYALTDYVDVASRQLSIGRMIIIRSPALTGLALTERNGSSYRIGSGLN